MPGRPRAPRPHPGGNSSPIPRGYGLTLETIRKELKLKPDEFDQKMADTPSKFLEPKRKAGATLGTRVEEWEKAATNISFASQHRYGRLSRTKPGVLLLASHFYKHIRDAIDTNKRQDEIEKAHDMADRLIAFALNAKAMLNDYHNLVGSLDGDAWSDPEVRDRHGEMVVSRLLDGYRNRKENP